MPIKIAELRPPWSALTTAILIHMILIRHLLRRVNGRKP